MNNGIDRSTFKDPVQGAGVQQIGFVKFQRFARDLLYPLERFLLAVDKIIEDNHVIPRLKQYQTGVAADIPGSARYQYPCVTHFPASRGGQ